MLTRHARLDIASDVLCADVDGETVLLNQRSGIYFSLDDVGSRIWSLLAQQTPLDEIQATLLREYTVTSDVCWNDLLRLVSELKDEGLVSEVG